MLWRVVLIAGIRDVDTNNVTVYSNVGRSNILQALVVVILNHC